MDLSRRQLIQGVLSGTVLISTPAFAALPDRYQELVQVQHELFAIGKDMRAYASANLFEGRIVFDEKLFAAFGYIPAITRLMVVLRDRFGDLTPILVDPDAANIKAKAVMLTGSIDTLDEDELRLYEDYIVTIAVLSRMLKFEALPWPKNLPVTLNTDVLLRAII